MSKKEFSDDGNVPHIPEEHVDEEAESSASENDERGEEEQDVEGHPIETESRDSGHDSPLEGAVGGSRDSGHDSPLEGAVGGALSDDDFRLTARQRRRISSGKEDLFRKFFSKEYDQVKAPILDRHRHSAHRQRVRQRHVSEDSKLSDPNPLGCLQDAGTSSGAILNQAGAIIGKNIPTEEIPDFERYGTEFGQSLPLVPRVEGSDRSVGSIATARIGELYGGTFSRPPSDDSRGLSPGFSFASFPSRPPTAASDNLKISPPPDIESTEESRSSPTPADSGSLAVEKPIRQRRSGVTQLLPVRSKSALAGTSAYCTDESMNSESQKRKLSKALSVCSEPLPERKISKESIDYEQMSIEDEDANYPELSLPLESDSCLPMPDIDPAAVASLQENFALAVISDETKQDVVEQEPDDENDPSEHLDDEASQQPENE